MSKKSRSGAGGGVAALAPPVPELSFCKLLKCLGILRLINYLLHFC